MGTGSVHMDTIPILSLPVDPGLEACFCGLFISSGVGRHISRTMDSWEIIIVERGHLGIAVGGEAHDVGPGEWLVIPAGVPHSGTADFPPDLRFAWMHFRPRAGRGLALPARGVIHDPTGTVALVRRLLAASTAPQPDPLVTALHLALLIAELTKTPGSASITSLLATRAFRSIRVNYRDPKFSTAVLAKQLDVSPDHLARSFRKAHGQTVGEFINACRLNEAKRLLVIGGLDIARVAEAAGFSGTQWLRRLLHRTDGVSPREWRRIHARLHVNSI